LKTSPAPSPSWSATTLPGSMARHCAPTAASCKGANLFSIPLPFHSNTFRKVIIMKSVILVTGASTGIGHLSARSLAQAGHTVYASMRDTEGRNAPKVRELRDWSFANGHDLRAVELDVLSQASADAAVAHIVTEQGRLDVVVHNAGHLVVGPTEAFTPEEIIKVLDTNFLGSQRVNRAVLPVMRAKEAGLVLWVSRTTVRGGL